MEWKNLDTLTSFEELSKVAEVDLTKVMFEKTVQSV